MMVGFVTSLTYMIEKAVMNVDTVIPPKWNTFCFSVFLLIFCGKFFIKYIFTKSANNDGSICFF